MLKLEPVCRICKVGPSSIIDHTVAIGLGGAIWDTLNLQPICKSCDAEKRGRESQEYRRRGISKA